MSMDLVQRMAMLVAVNAGVVTTVVFMVFRGLLRRMRNLEVQLAELRYNSEHRREQRCEQTSEPVSP